MTKLFEKPNASLREQAYARIKRKIVTTEYRPGDYLNEAKISAQLKIGRTPVHQAIDQLNIEGLVNVMPRKGVVVRPISLDEISEIIETRLVNERYCASLAAQRATKDHIAEMEQILEAAQNSIVSRDQEALMEADYQFHKAIASAANNRTLAEILRVLHERELRFWFISLGEMKHVTEVQEEHGNILKAIKARNSDAAAAAMADHIASFRSNIIRSM